MRDVIKLCLEEMGDEAADQPQFVGIRQIEVACGRLPIVNFKGMDAPLRLRRGFVAVRQTGSHVFYRHPDGRTAAVSNHPGRDLARPLIR